MTLLCKGAHAPVAAHLKGQRVNAPVLQPHSGIPGYIVHLLSDFQVQNCCSRTCFSATVSSLKSTQLKTLIVKLKDFPFEILLCEECTDGTLRVRRRIVAILSTDTNKFFALLNATKLIRKPRYSTAKR